MSSLEELRIKYVNDRPTYVAYANYIADKLRAETEAHHFDPKIEARAKEVDSFIKKQYKWKFPNPYEDMYDKAGVRVTVRYDVHAKTVGEIIEATFNARPPDRKIDKLAAHELGYLGVHYLVKLKNSQITADLEDFRELTCEIQVHTAAQNLWSSVSHDLAYKPRQEVPKGQLRPLYRLMALIEIFDSEVTRVRSQITSNGHSTAWVLDLLDKEYYKLTSKPYDEGLSFQTLEALMHAYSQDELAHFGEVINTFVRENEYHLSEIYRRYAKSESLVGMIVYQPEAILTFERLNGHQAALQNNWPLPDEMLQELASVWGVTLV